MTAPDLLAAETVLQTAERYCASDAAASSGDPL
jgi:hypothetical protein